MLFDLLADRVEQKLAQNIQAAYRGCRSDANGTADTLRAEMEVYWTQLSELSRVDEFFDDEVAEKTYRGCTILLDHLASHPEPSAELTEVIGAAVRYFILEDDAVDDSDILGLDDDLEVVEATAAVLEISLTPGAGQ